MPFAFSTSFLPFFRRAGSVGGVERRLPRCLSWGLPSPSRRSVGEERGRGTRVVASGGECDSVASSLLGVGVVGPSRSQEAPVLARPAPLSVDSPASVESDARSLSSEVGGSSRGPLPLSLFPD